MIMQILCGSDRYQDSSSVENFSMSGCALCVNMQDSINFFLYICVHGVHEGKKQFNRNEWVYVILFKTITKFS